MTTSSESSSDIFSGIAALIGPAQAPRSTFTANGHAPVTVAAAQVTANSIVVLSIRTIGGTPGWHPTIELTPGVGFTAYGEASDTSVYNYLVL